MNADGCLVFATMLFIILKEESERVSKYVTSHHEGTEGWTEWPDLPPVAQNKWLDKVAETLQWDELQGGKVANLHSISASEFSRALVGSLA